MTRRGPSSSSGDTVGLRRMAAQQFTAHRFTHPREVVGFMGAVQAQDEVAARWALGLRLPAGTATEASIEQALEDGSVLRTHALRGTLQLIAPEDLRWIVALVAPRLIAGNARRYRELELDERTFRKSEEALRAAFARGRARTRTGLGRHLEEAGIATGGQRLAYLLQRAELEAVICSGRRQGKRPTYALVEERLPAQVPGPTLEPAEALAELARRYFRSRGPATAEDFAWWSGQTLTQARSGIENAKAGLQSEVIAGRTYWGGESYGEFSAGRQAYLLPAFDEYLVGYRDRQAVLDPRHARRVNEGGGMLNPSIVLDGRVIGTWRRERGSSGVRVELSLFEEPVASATRLIAAAVRRYGAFLGLPARIG